MDAYSGSGFVSAPCLHVLQHAYYWNKALIMDRCRLSVNLASATSRRLRLQYNKNRNTFRRRTSALKSTTRLLLNKDVVSVGTRTPRRKDSCTLGTGMSTMDTHKDRHKDMDATSRNLSRDLSRREVALRMEDTAVGAGMAMVVHRRLVLLMMDRMKYVLFHHLLSERAVLI